MGVQAAQPPRVQTERDRLVPPREAALPPPRLVVALPQRLPEKSELRPSMLSLQQKRCCKPSNPCFPSKHTEGHAHQAGVHPPGQGQLLAALLRGHGQVLQRSLIVCFLPVRLLITSWPLWRHCLPRFPCCSHSVVVPSIPSSSLSHVLFSQTWRNASRTCWS